MSEFLIVEKKIVSSLPTGCLSPSTITPPNVFSPVYWNLQRVRTLCFLSWLISCFFLKKLYHSFIGWNEYYGTTILSLLPYILICGLIPLTKLGPLSTFYYLLIPGLFMLSFLNQFPYCIICVHSIILTTPFPLNVSIVLKVRHQELNVISSELCLHGREKTRDLAGHGG